MRKLNIIRHIFSILLLLVLGFSVTYSWFARSNNIDPQLSDATIIKQYFHTGSGTEEDPFVITRPVHYYNLVQLFQRTSGFAVDGDASKVYYFQLGYELDNTSEGLEFYNYDDDGNQINTSGNKYSKELNLEFYNGSNALLPIGTSDIPFNDVFNGSGLTVKNLHVKATETVGDVTFGTADIGIFGYVTEEASISNVYYSNFDIDLTGTDPTRTVSGHNSDVHDSDNNHTADLVYVGYIAGHVNLATTISNVYINNCKIIGGNAAKSSFGYFGCVESTGDVDVPTLGELIANLHTSGEGAGFGGSIKMKDILERLVAIASTNVSSTITTYGNIETITIDERKNTQVYNTVSTKNITYIDTSQYNRDDYRYYKHSDYDGQYYFIDSLSGDHRYEGLFGTNSLNKKSIITFTYKDNDLDAWYIKNGDTYLSASNLALASANAEDQAAKWVYEENSDGTYYLCCYLETYTNDTTVKYYLNRSGNYGLTISNSASTKWNLTNVDSGDSFTSKLYTVVNGENRYIEYDSNTNTWKLVPYLSYYIIKQGDNNYLSNNGSDIINTTTEANAMRLISSTNPLTDNSDISLYTIIDNEKKYLICDGELKIANSPTQWHYANNELSITYSKDSLLDIKYILGYDGTKWGVYAVSGKVINDGNDHYMTVQNGGVGSSDESSASLWQFSNSSGNTAIYTVVDGEIKYLSYSTSKGLYFDDDSFEWKRSGNIFYFTSGNTDYYLGYSNGWCVQKLDYLVIGSDNNYLRVTGVNQFESTTQENATHFYSSGLSESSSSGTLYCAINGAYYYLINDNGALSTSDTTQTTWTYNADGVLKSGNYYIDLIDTTWTITHLANGEGYYYLISSGNNYLSANNTTIANETSKASATKWIFSNDDGNNSSGTIRNAATTNSYLYGSASWWGNGTFECGTTQSSWTNNNRVLSVDGGGGWFSSTGYIRFNNNAWSLNTNNGTTLTFERRTINVNISEMVGDIPNVYETDVTRSYSVDVLNKNVNSDETFTKTSQQEFEKSVKANVNGGYDTYFPIKIADSDEGSWYDASDPYKVSMKNTGYIIGGARLYDTEPNTSAFQTGFGDIRISYFPISNISSSYDDSALTSSKISYNNNYLILNDAKNAVANTTDEENAIFWDFTSTATNTYRISTVIDSVTYYLRYNNGLTITTDQGDSTSWTYVSSNNRFYSRTGNNNRGYYIQYSNGWSTTNNINNPGNATNLTVTKGGFTTIYTVNDNGRTQTPANTDAFKEAKRQLVETLNGSASVYGLHFMNAQISKDYLVTAPKVAVLGREFDNYEMPQDSIDFHVIDRGSINFFAGNYFDGNNTFFSLHKVFRDGNNKITDIMEIIEVYEKTNANQNYIYKLKDSSGNYTFTNADGSYTGATSLASGYNSTPIFKTSWITNPGISKGSQLYYFEVPCNAGEYCLGSVTGKTGAYLVYLDIASNGGEAISNVISAEGNSVTKAFNVEYRDRPDAIEEGGHSIIQIGADIPTGATSSNFSIDVSFDSSQTGANNEYANGLYTITVVNKTGANVTLDVFICDNNDNAFDTFPYAYRIKYINESHSTETTIHTLITDKDYFQSMGSFTIPSSGDAVESSYVS